VYAIYYGNLARFGQMDTFLETTGHPMGTSSAKEDAATPRGKAILVAVLVLAAVGFGVASHLTRIHYFTHTDPAYSSMCAVSERVNCETVAESAYSVFLGLPVSCWGLLAYALTATLAIFGLSRSRLHATWPYGALLFLATAALAGSAILAYLSFFRIDSMCIFCMILYAVNAALFALCTALAVRSRRSPVALVAADLAAAIKRPLPVLAFAAVFGGGAAAAELLVPPYWIHLGWSDLPALPMGVDEKGHWIGAERPLVIVTEFSDYECPHCRRAHRNIRQMAARYPDAVRLVHRHQPLDDACNKALKKPFHRRACEFSRAVECAGEQEMFWEMNDALFSIQDEVRASEVDLDALAVRIGLDRSRFKECLASEAPRRRIAADIADAERRGVEGTPTYFIGERMFPGGFEESVLAAAVKNAKARR
jgi:protein-disulfide isomerase